MKETQLVVLHSNKATKINILPPTSYTQHISTQSNNYCPNSPHLTCFRSCRFLYVQLCHLQCASFCWGPEASWVQNHHSLKRGNSGLPTSVHHRKPSSQQQDSCHPPFVVYGIPRCRSTALRIGGQLSVSKVQIKAASRNGCSNWNPAAKRFSLMTKRDSKDHKWRKPRFLSLSTK